MRYIRALETWLNRLSRWKVDHLGDKHSHAKEILEGIRDQLQGMPTTASKSEFASLHHNLNTS